MMTRTVPPGTVRCPMKEIGKVMEKVMEGIRKVTLEISVAAILIMAVLEIVEIFNRSVLNHSLMIVDEYAGYLMSCMVFMGLCHSYNSGSFVRVEAIYGRFKGQFKKYIDVIYTFIMIVFTAVFGYYSVLLNYKSFTKHLVSTGYYMTPLWIPQVFMSIGVICFFIYTIMDLIMKIRNLKEKGGEA